MVVAVTKTKLFQSNRSQALRLPKDVAFPATVRDVAIVRDGARRVVVPANAIWDDFFDRPGIDIEDRVQPSYPQREAF
jgi:antitoxin VapB